MVEPFVYNYYYIVEQYNQKTLERIERIKQYVIVCTYDNHNDDKQKTLEMTI